MRKFIETIPAIARPFVLVVVPVTVLHYIMMTPRKRPLGNPAPAAAKLVPR